MLPPQGGAAVLTGWKEEGQEAAAGWGGFQGCWSVKTDHLLRDQSQGLSQDRQLTLQALQVLPDGQSFFPVLTAHFMPLTQQAGTQQRAKKLGGSP